MAARYVLIRRRHLRRLRIFRDRSNPLEVLDDQDLITMYRLSRPAILQVCQLLQGHLVRPTNRSHSLPVYMQVLVALKFYATGSFQQTVGYCHNLSRSSISWSVRDVSQSLTDNCRMFISFPTGRQLLQTMQQFAEKTNFPNVVGVIDGTHILIKAPREDEHLYVNRKGSHSINTQVVCDSNMKITDIVAKWPGASHDSFIWSNSALSTKFENGDIGDGWLLGDSGYPLRPWLMTPVLHPTTQQEERSVVERCFGVMKMRFKCLDKTGGTLSYSPIRTCKIIIAVAVLHNLCLFHNIPWDEHQHQPVHDHVDNPVYNGRQNDGANTRQQLIMNRF